VNRLAYDNIQKLIDQYIKTSFQVNRMGESLVKDQLSKELTNDQHYTLRFIFQHERCTSTDLAEAFHVNKSAITAIITRLTDKGLIERTRDENDRRVVYLSLTEKGKELYLETEEKIHQLVKHFITKFDRKEIESFMHTYEKLSHILINMNNKEGEKE